MFNVQCYYQEKKGIMDSLDKINHDEFVKSGKPVLNNGLNVFGLEEEREREDVWIDENLKFMDFVVYTVLIDDVDAFQGIINHSPM